jgi:hypothetical protein
MLLVWMHSNDMQMQEKDNLILKLTFQFSLDIIIFTEKLRRDKKFNLANQLFRNGTATGANVREAQGCESKQDFTHKMKIAIRRRRRRGIGWSCVNKRKVIQNQVNFWMISLLF